MEKQLQICSLEQSELLRKAGFDWEVHSFYRNNEEDVIFGMSAKNYNSEEWRNLISAPTVAHALKWFRDVKKIALDICISITAEGKWRYRNGLSLCCKLFDTYELAESALLEELILLTLRNKKIMCDCIRKIKEQVLLKMQQEQGFTEVIEEPEFVNYARYPKMLYSSIIGRYLIGEKSRKFEVDANHSFCPFCGEEYK